METLACESIVQLLYDVYDFMWNSILSKDLTKYLVVYTIKCLLEVYKIYISWLGLIRCVPGGHRTTTVAFHPCFAMVFPSFPRFCYFFFNSFGFLQSQLFGFPHFLAWASLKRHNLSKCEFCASKLVSYEFYTNIQFFTKMLWWNKENKGVK
jgi:hypothetical protein